MSEPFEVYQEKEDSMRGSIQMSDKSRESVKNVEIASNIEIIPSIKLNKQNEWK